MRRFFLLLGAVACHLIAIAILLYVPLAIGIYIVVVMALAMAICLHASINQAIKEVTAKQKENMDNTLVWIMSTQATRKYPVPEPEHTNVIKPSLTLRSHH